MGNIDRPSRSRTPFDPRPLSRHDTHQQTNARNNVAIVADHARVNHPGSARANVRACIATPMCRRP
eukprot:8474938-Pyramimonas_sp.AAC.1